MQEPAGPRANRKPSRNNHVVTASYMGGGFGSPGKDGRRAWVDAFDKRDGVVRGVRAEDTCRQRDFSVVITGEGFDDSLEQQWSEREKGLMTVIRGISPACPPSTKEQYAIRLLMVLHLARSFAMKRRIDAAMTGRLKQFVADIPSNADLAREFKARTGRHALDGEIEGVVVDYQRKLMASNTFHVTRQAEWFNRLLDDLEAMPVSVSYSAGRKGQYFITSDSPVVLHDRAHGRASPIGWGVGLQDADSILMPITRRLCGVAGLGLGPILGSDSVQKLNAFQFRHAERFVIAHPDTELAIVAPELLVMSRVP